MNRNILFGAIGAAVIAVGGFFALNSGNTVGETLVSPAAAQDAEVDISGVKDMSMGAEDAPITMVEYASFTCPHCRTFHENVFKDLKKDYIDTGKVKFVFREVYFDRFGLWAGMVARCGGGDRYFGLVDMIFDTQDTWPRGEPADVAGNLRKMGLLAGLDGDTVDTCMRDADKAKALQAFYETNATADGVRSTPTFIINGTLHNNMSYAEMQKILDAEL